MFWSNISFRLTKSWFFIFDVKLWSVAPHFNPSRIFQRGKRRLNHQRIDRSPISVSQSLPLRRTWGLNHQATNCMFPLWFWLVSSLHKLAYSSCVCHEVIFMKVLNASMSFTSTTFLYVLSIRFYLIWSECEIKWVGQEKNGRGSWQCKCCPQCCPVKIYFVIFFFKFPACSGLMMSQSDNPATVTSTNMWT